MKYLSYKFFMNLDERNRESYFNWLMQRLIEKESILAIQTEINMNKIKKEE